MNLREEVYGLISFIQDSVQSANKNGCVVGVSGGIDSAVVLALCARAYPNSTIGISMPRFKHLQSTERAQELCKALDVPLYNSPVYMEDKASPYYQDPNYILSGDNLKMAEGNYSARIRMAKLYFYAEIKKSLVIGTDNATENFLGYYTKYGDGGVDINPIGNYYKYEVYQLAKFLNIPKSIIKAKPSAELFDGHTDESELGLSYDELDNAIRVIKGEVLYKKVDQHKINFVKKMHEKTKHKRELPPSYIRKD